MLIRDPQDALTRPPTTAVVRDHAQKRSRVLRILERERATAIWLTSPAAVSWYLDGARVHTSLAGPPVAAVRVSRDGDLVRAFENEFDRLRAEEIPAHLDAEAVDWFAPLTDADGIAEDAVELALREARATLLPRERERYARLCAEAAALLTDVLAEATPDESEERLAARVAAGVTAVGADPLVVMVAGVSRLGYRHPLPTSERLGARAMVVVCARRHGMIANLTRWVRFRPVSDHLARRSAALLRVESDVWRATLPGHNLGQVLAAAADAYRRHGFDGEEWRRHHQGGAAGYAGRDPRATPSTLDRVHDGQAFAWNPTAPATKVEDTVIVDSGAVTVLTADRRWPAASVDGILRPLELEP